MAESVANSALSAKVASSSALAISSAAVPLSVVPSSCSISKTRSLGIDGMASLALATFGVSVLLALVAGWIILLSGLDKERAVPSLSLISIMSVLVLSPVFFHMWHFPKQKTNINHNAPNRNPIAVLSHPINPSETSRTRRRKAGSPAGNNLF